MPKTAADNRRAVVPCVAEALEGRQLMSAATVLAALRPLAEWPAHVRQVESRPLHWPTAAVAATPSVGAAKKAKAVDVGPNLLGTWSGTFTNNSTGAPAAGSIEFTVNRKQAFTGNFNLSAIGGSAKSTVSVKHDRRFLAVVPLGNKQQISLAGNVTGDEKAIIGRYSVLVGKKGWATGVFRLTRAG